jgi:thiamine biosynthesis lipoprotein
VIAGCFRAMGTTVAVTAVDDAGIEATRLLFEDVEATLSRFRPDSELSRVNEAPGVSAQLGPMLAEVLHLAADLRTRTDGLVDVAVGAEVVAWGYDRSFETMPDVVAASPSPLPGRWWQLDGDRLTRRPGTAIDVGGVAKGWTCDLAVDRGLALMVSAGGDVRSAIDSATVDVADPAGAVVATVDLGRGALATSSTARRRWTAGGLPAHHIIDPRTGDPARTPVVSATAIAATAAEAEAAAKAVLIRGTDGLAWADEQPWIDGAIAVWHDGAVYATTRTGLAA